MNPDRIRLVLASQSPRRRELLAAAGFRFRVEVSGVEEVRREGEAPADYVQRLAESKASAVALAEGEVALGADTVVVAGGEVLEKPRDAADAARMLRLLSGRAHEVMTGICVRTATETLVDVEVTRVVFSALSEEEIAEYVATGEPLDRAGAYAIQGLASKFAERVEGCYFSVVGLPVGRVYRKLASLNLPG